MPSLQAELKTSIFWSSLAVSLASGLAAQAVLVLDPGAFTVHWFRQGSVLLAVHLTTLGFLGALVLGVLSQFLPMLLGRGLGSLLWSALSLALFTASALALWCFFAHWRSSGLAAAAALGLGLSVALFSGLCLDALLHGAPVHRLSRATLAASLACLLLAALLGGLLAQGLAGEPVLSLDPLLALSLHVQLALVGFGALMVFGVSYELLPMFNLAKDYATWPAWSALGLTLLGLVLLAGAALGLAPAQGPAFTAWPWLLALAALAYALQILFIQRRALRRPREASVWLFRQSVVFLLAGAVWGLRLRSAELGSGASAAWLYLLLFGFLGGAILSQLQKIVPLLSWYDRFAPLVGRKAVPTAAQLLDGRAAWAVLPLHALATLAGALGLAQAQPGLVRASGLLGLACLLATAWLSLASRRRGAAIDLSAAAPAAALGGSHG